MRKLLVIGVIVVVLVVAAVALVATNLERIVNSQKDTILARVEAQVGRDVSIGDIGVTLRRGLGVRLENVTVGEDPAFGAEPFVQASDVQVNVKLLPLLRKEIQVKRVILREPVIRIVKNKDGVLNTQSLARQAAGAGDAAGQTQEPSAAATVPLVVSLASIENGELDFIDEAQGFALRVLKIDTSVKDFDLEKPLAIDLKAALLAEDQNVKMGGAIGPLPLETPAQGAPPVAVPLDIEASVDGLELGAVMAAFPRMAESLPKDVSLRGPVGLRARASGTTANMRITATLDGSRTEAEVPDKFKKSAGVPLSVDAKCVYTPERLLIEAAKIVFASLEMNVRGEYAMTKPPAIALDIDSKNIDLSGWGDILPMAALYQLSGRAEVGARAQGKVGPGEKPDVRGKATIANASATVPQMRKPVTGIAAEISFTQQDAVVERASFQIGDSRVEGRAKIESFAPMTLAYEVTSPSLALADFAPPQPTVKKPERLDDLAARGRITVDPVKKEPSGEGTIASPSGSVANIDYTSLGASYAIAGRTTRVTQLKARALEGEIAGSGVVTTGEAGNAFDLKLSADKVDISELFTSLPGSVHEVLSGKASLNLDISGSGREWTDMQKTLKGAGLADILDGEVFDINFGAAIFEEVGRYVGSTDFITAQLRSKYPSVFENRSTAFKNLKSDFVIENGRLLARNLNLRHDDYRIGAKGSIGFDKSLDVAATFVVSKRLADDLARSYQAVSYLRNAQGEIELPLVLGGTMPNVEVKPDPEFFKGAVSKGLMEKGLDALKDDRIKKLLPPGLKTSAPADTTKARP